MRIGRFARDDDVARGGHVGQPAGLVEADGVLVAGHGEGVHVVGLDEADGRPDRDRHGRFERSQRAAAMQPQTRARRKDAGRGRELDGLARPQGEALDLAGGVEAHVDDLGGDFAEREREREGPGQLQLFGLGPSETNVSVQREDSVQLTVLVEGDQLGGDGAEGGGNEGLALQIDDADRSGGVEGHRLGILGSDVRLGVVRDEIPAAGGHDIQLVELALGHDPVRVVAVLGDAAEFDACGGEHSRSLSWRQRSGALQWCICLL